MTSVAADPSPERPRPSTSAWEQEILLSTYPPGTEILATQSYRPGYRSYPARVTVRTPAGSTEHCVIKTGDRIELLEREAGVLRALAEMGLPVPAVLAGPVALPDQAPGSALLVLSELRGKPLPWLGLTSLAAADLTCRLLIEGVLRLHRLTERVSQHEIAATLPRITLFSELEQIVQRAEEWRELELFARAVDRLRAALADVQTPLVFSNGDYNPLNFLHDGGALSGWVDFEGACFEDPHIGFAKFLIWSHDEIGWGAGVKAGLLERYLYAQNLTRRQFAPHLFLRRLRHLQEEAPLSGSEDTGRRGELLRLLEEGLSALE